jgi:ribosomal protein S18 acetylase RimI-like enzyme
MNAIDRTLKYVDLYLVKDLNDIPCYQLPEGYSFVLFKDGDEKDWVEIEMSSGEFISFEEGMKAFQHYYGEHYEELKKLCIFVENNKGEKVATSTAFYLENPISDITGNVHWVSVKSEYQGKKLSKPLIVETLKLLKKLGHKKTLLHTQTHTWLAVKIYLDVGFEPYKLEDNYLGWQIIKKVTNHTKLSNINEIEYTDIYNSLYVQAHEFLKEKFKEPFNYKVWDEKGRFIGINYNGKVYYYKYTYKNEHLEIISEVDEDDVLKYL